MPYIRRRDSFAAAVGLSIIKRINKKTFYTYYETLDALLSELQSELSAGFLDRVYGGKLGLMVNALVEDHALTQEDIDELSAILKKAGERE